MGDTPLTTFLRANYVMWLVKKQTKRSYQNFDDATLQRMASEALASAAQLGDAHLTQYLPEQKGLTPTIRRLPYDRFSWETYTADELVPTLWVSDVPHTVTHGTMRDVLRFARDDRNRTSSPLFFRRITRLRSLSILRSLPILVVGPSRSQRSDRRDHSPDTQNPQPPPLCEVPYLAEGKAYIEDGNHRGTATLLDSTEERIRAVRFHALP